MNLCVFQVSINPALPLLKSSNTTRAQLTPTQPLFQPQSNPRNLRAQQPPLLKPSKDAPIEKPKTPETLPDAIPRWFLIGSTSLGLAFLLLAFDGQREAMALGPEGPLVEEFWDNMRRYVLYALTVSTGAVYTILQPIFELLKNPITAILILIVLVGSGIVVSQVLNAMVGNSDFTYKYG